MSESRPLEDMLTKAMSDGSKHISLVPDKEGRFQANIQKGRSATFSCHVANDPVEALYGALGGLPAIKLWRQSKAEEWDVCAEADEPPETAKKMTYWYHPESDSVWAHLGEFPPEMEASADVMLSNEITEEQYHEFLAMQKAEKAKPAAIIDPEVDDLL
jgi:hypothetical protein